MALISSFMNRFRELGFIEYNGTLVVHSSLLNWSFMTGQEARGWIRQVDLGSPAQLSLNEATAPARQAVAKLRYAVAAVFIGPRTVITLLEQVCAFA